MAELRLGSRLPGCGAGALSAGNTGSELETHEGGDSVLPTAVIPLPGTQLCAQLIIAG